MSRKLMVIVIALGLVGSVAGIYAKPAPKKLTIKKCGKKKKPVTFDHEKHVKAHKIKCRTCHHETKETKKAKPCASCHAGKAKKEKGKLTPGCAEASSKKNPYHITCVGCHKKQKKGPKTCKACHR